ncbi:Dipeptidyl aminopeptidase/acylaminoacyl peptidase [Maribacter aquivivus]|uniref:Dipeptidyl aminopeptidase/acylaminoacyl peptidase n=1 Tax=Maribacter aquivivus TaxID=228958 RepID=A0A1M6RIK1_9FLAO|nr:alpha/beta fold hydrolase [Maribacter aquivivus]SHK32295.1 Dipeptidyl aminopeptidase/acylaminoacyl peptidase [Maribacter aquivivus]
MKKLFACFAISLIWSCTEKKEVQKEVEKEIEITKIPDKYTIKQMMDNEAISGGSFYHDNSKLLVSSNRSGIYNMYTVPAKGGELTPITQSDSASVFAISYFPRDERMLFSMDGNGDEIYHIYIRNLNGSHTDLTPAKGARASFHGWAEDNQSFFFTSNKRDSKYMDLYQMDFLDYSPKLIFKNEEGYDIGNLSKDEKYLTLSKSLNTNDSDLYLLDLATEKKIKINKTQRANSSQDFSPSGDELYYTTDEGSEFSYLMKYNIASGASDTVLTRDWDILGSYFTENGTYLVTYINEDAKNTIEVMNVATMENIDLPSFKSMAITNVDFSKDEKWMRFYAGGSHTPSNLYVYNLETKEQKQLTDVLNPEIKTEDLVTAEVVRYKSFDGVEIPAIYYKPHQASADAKVPALVWVHGGPGGQSRQNFSSFIQYLTNHGYAVLAVNNRGSSGYGKTFFQMDDLNHGDKDLKDCVEGKNWLAAQPEIDAEKIGIIGGSYGGYMTMAALTYTPEEFAVGVNLFGVTNWIRTLKSIPPWWESFKDALYLELGDPYSADSVRLKEISPLFHTDKVTKPLIVLQGSQDPRVLQVESDEIVAGVKKNGVPVEYVLFEDEGHGFVKKENQIEAYSRVLQFLDEYLKKDKGTAIEDDTPIKGKP